MPKLFATEMACRVVDHTVQLHCGYGVVREMPVERLYRTVRQPRVYEGTSEIQRIVIARHILRDRERGIAYCVRQPAAEPYATGGPGCELEWA